MADEVRNPHDKLFRAVFSDAAEAGSLMQMALPPALRQELDWETLTLLEGTFLDDTLRESESDLLYEVVHAGSGERVWLYVLMEHQSTPDGWMRFRLLKYCCRIWDASLREGETSTGEPGLRPIVPLVFYQGRDGWRIRGSLQTCSRRGCGSGRGCRGSDTCCWTRQGWSLEEWAAGRRVAWRSC